jgi:protein-export membrane protein SecD
LRRLFSPGVRGRVRWAILAVVLLGVLTGTIDYPKPWNTLAARTNDWTAKTRYGKWFRLPNAHYAPYKLGLDLLGGTHLLYEADVAAITEKERADALAGVRDVIERRVNSFGVSEPLVQTNRTGDHYRVIVELAGIRDVNQAIKMIGETPTLDFRERAPDTATVPQKLVYNEAAKKMDEYNAAAKKKAEGILRRALAGEDFSKLAAANSEDPGSKTKGGDLGYFGKGTMVKEFEDGVWSLKVGQINPKLVQSGFGYHIIKKIGQRTTDGKEEVSASHILIATQSPDQTASSSQLPGWTPTQLTGKQLKRAQVTFNQQTGEPTVQLAFNDEGDKLFADITERNIGKQVGIFLDGQPISAPVVQQKITGGTAVITGSFTVQEAKLLAQRLNAGALPVPIKLVSQQTVDATLGDVSLQRSLFAGLLGIAAVILFMLIFYRLPGVLASVALLIYTAITITVFKLIGVTMTLAGIAGFILSVGMAVDANILIFERTKEELRRGRTLKDGLSEGFKRAWNSIRDSNVSSLITSGILIWFGTSTVRGFAITLAIGILVSMFSAITVTRTFLRFIIGPSLERHLWLFGGHLGSKSNPSA